MRTRTICSIFWDDLTAARAVAPQPGMPNETTYSIPACKPGEHKTLTVADAYQWAYAGNGRWDWHPTYADGIDGLAQDLVQYWGRNVIYGSGNSGPGIFICAGDAPTEAEIEAAVERQTNWANRLIDEAESAWVQGRRHEIKDLQRKAARWLGRQDLQWVTQKKQVTLVNCPLCRNSIDSLAVVCPNCHNIVDFSRYTEYTAKREQLEEKLKALRTKDDVPSETPKAPLPPPMAPTAPKRASA